MKRLAMPFLLALLSVSMAVPGCAGAYDRCIKPVTSQITWAGSGKELVDVVAQFLLCDGGSSVMAPPCAVSTLADLASALGPGGTQVVNCLLKYHVENGTPQLRARARAVGAKRGVIVGSLQCGGTLAQAGNVTPPAAKHPDDMAGSYFMHGEEGPYQPPAATFASGDSPMGGCGQPGMHDLSPAFPGAACIRDDLTWSALLRLVRRQCEHRPCEVGFKHSSPLADATVQMSGARYFDMSVTR